MDISQILCLAMFATFAALLMTGFPVAWVLGGTAVIFAVVGHIAVAYFDAAIWFGWSSSIGILPARFWPVLSSTILVALPMFIFMGVMLDKSGVAERLMNNMAKLFGRVRGGYAVTVAVIGVLLAASTGIVGASVVLLGMMSLPVMMEQKYSKALATGTVCAAGTLGILLPPSIMLVIMSSRLGRPETSVGDLFMGAVFPGLLLGALYITYILVFAWLWPHSAPLPKDRPKLTPRVFWDVLVAVLPTAGLILAVLGSIFFGLATPSEASGVGAAGATLLALVNRRLNLQVLKEALYQTTKTTAFIFAILFGATAFSVVLRNLGGDEVIADALLDLPFGPVGIIIFILFFTFLLGFFLEWIEITLIVLPLVAPVVLELGFNLAWFTIMFAMCLQTAFLSPPVGYTLFYVKGVAPPEIKTTDIYKGVTPFMLLQLTGVAIVFIWPALVTWLPSVAFN